MKILICISILFISFAGIAADKKGSSNKGGGLVVGLKSGVTLKSFESTPDGFSDSDIAPPLGSLIIGLKGKAGNLATLTMDAELSVLPGAATYAYGDFGLQFNISRIDLKAGLAAQQMISGGDKLSSTQFDNFAYGWFVDLAIPLGFITPGILYRTLTLSPAEISNHENLVTKINSDGNSLVQPYLELDLAIIKLIGSYGIYSSGKVGVASKDFALGLDETSINIITAGVGLAIGSTDLWIKYQQIDGIDDPVSYYYQAPFFTPTYLLAKESAFVEVIWKF